MKDTPELYKTAPLVVFCPRLQTYKLANLSTGAKYEALAPSVLRVLWNHLGATSIPQGEGEESGEAAIAAIEEALLRSAGEGDLDDGNLWEVRNWSRAAFLTFTQLNIPYLEPAPSSQSLDELRFERRQAIENYDVASFPPRAIRRDSPSIALPLPTTPRGLDLDALYSRRSHRSFSHEPTPFDAFNGSLYQATENVRISEATRASGDAYFILNSFYSWLNIYVAVQGVDGLERGLYQYDPEQHELRDIGGRGFPDAAISKCIQGQSWVGGGGFCVFVSAQWERYAWIYRHSRAYINLLIQLGEFGQELLAAAYSNGLVGWMTPAVTESRAAELMGIDTAHEDIIYFLKFGYPAA